MAGIILYLLDFLNHGHTPGTSQANAHHIAFFAADISGSIFHLLVMCLVLSVESVINCSYTYIVIL